jgi:hypothetical protein
VSSRQDLFFPQKYFHGGMVSTGNIVVPVRHEYTDKHVREKSGSNIPERALIIPAPHSIMAPGQQVRSDGFPEMLDYSYP